MLNPILFLDLDGVLLDIKERSFAVYRDILAAHKKEALGKDAYWELKRSKTPLKDVLARTGAEGTYEEFKQAWMARIEDPRYLQLDTLFPGTLEALGNLAETRDLVLVTLRHEKQAMLGQMKDLGLDAFFRDVLVASGREGKEKWKKKAALMSAMEHDDRAAVCGDTETDITAGKELGIRTIAACSGMRTREFLQTLRPDALIPDIRELPDALARPLRERERISAVAKWYQPDAEQGKMESALIGYRLDTMMPRIKGPGVLEMGCSTGIMTRRLAEAFSDLTVVEGSEEYVAHVRSVVGDHVSFFVSLFEEYEPGRRFDDIIMANILEHVEDPVSILRRAGGWLQPKGRIHVLVPNGESLHRKVGCAMGALKHSGDFTENDRKIGHRRVYTADTLEDDIRLAGLQARSKEGIFLKPFSHGQMDAFDSRVYDALYEVGKELPRYCSTIYMVCGHEA